TPPVRLRGEGEARPRRRSSNRRRHVGAQRGRQAEGSAGAAAGAGAPFHPEAAEPAEGHVRLAGRGIRMGAQPQGNGHEQAAVPPV
ncbi:hypothetical protein MNEG_10328, partial [Monoraphidium neglectum]